MSPREVEKQRGLEKETESEHESESEGVAETWDAILLNAMRVVCIEGHPHLLPKWVWGEGGWVRLRGFEDRVHLGWTGWRGLG